MQRYLLSSSTTRNDYMRKLRESETLARLLLRARDEHQKVLMVQDLWYRSRELLPVDRHRMAMLIAEGLQQYVGSSPDFDDLERAFPPTRIDVAFFVMNNAEEETAKFVFRLRDDMRLSVEDEMYYFFNLQTKLGRSLNCILCAVPEQGNSAAQRKTSNVISRFRPRLCILVGIAAGVRALDRNGKSVTDFNDVIVPLNFVYYGTVARYEDREVDRYKYFGRSSGLEEPVNRLRTMSIFSSSNGEKSEYVSHLIALEKDLNDKEKLDVSKVRLSPKLHLKQPILLTGDVLIKDEFHDGYYENHELTRGADMESYGFAIACEYPSGTPKPHWIVFRGVSDFGNPEKNDIAHYSAALAALLTARHFVTQELDSTRLFSTNVDF